MCLILGSLIGITPPLLPAQQNQSLQQLTQEIELLKGKISELEKQLQIVENVEKIELQAKLADANAKLANAEFAKLERELRDSNTKWLTGWVLFFLAIISAIGIVVLREFRSSADKLIKNEVEKNLDGFKEGLQEVDTLKNEIGVLKDQQRVLEREHTAATLEDFLYDPLWYEQNHPEQIKGLREEALLDVFGDKGRIQTIRYKAVEILVARQSPQSVPPILELLNSVLDSDDNFDYGTEDKLRGFMNSIRYIHTQEAYQGLTEFLNRLLTENLKQKDVFVRMFLTPAVYSISLTGFKLNLGDSVSILRLAIPYSEIRHGDSTAQSNLARYFDIFHEPEGIKEILGHHGTKLPSEVVDKCLELLEKHDPEFVEKWRSQHTTDDAES